MGSERRIFSATECISVVQGHPRSLITGGRLAAASGDPRETAILWQRISVLIQRFNAILIGETFLHPDEAPDL